MLLLPLLFPALLPPCLEFFRRADAENGFDELKNQWGWGGFTYLCFMNRRMPNGTSCGVGGRRE
jgi:hypothetical protein